MGVISVQDLLPGISGRTVVAEILYPDEKILEVIKKKKRRC